MSSGEDRCQNQIVRLRQPSRLCRWQPKPQPLDVVISLLSRVSGLGLTGQGCPWFSTVTRAARWPWLEPAARFFAGDRRSLAQPSVSERSVGDSDRRPATAMSLYTTLDWGLRQLRCAERQHPQEHRHKSRWRCRRVRPSPNAGGNADLTELCARAKPIAYIDRNYTPKRLLQRRARRSSERRGDCCPSAVRNRCHGFYIYLEN